MNRFHSIILAALIMSGCACHDPLTMDDLAFLLDGSDVSTSLFDENNMHLYSSHIDRIGKLEETGLITIETGSTDVNHITGPNANQQTTVLYTTQHKTDLGKAVIGKIHNKPVDSTAIPPELSKQLDDLEQNTSNKYNLNLLQYIFLTHSTSGSFDLGTTDAEILKTHNETIDLVKELSNKGYLQYEFDDSPFRGKPAKHFRWWPTQKGINFNAGIEDEPQ